MIVGFALFAVAAAHVHHHDHHRHKSGGAEADSAELSGQASFEDQREQEQPPHRPVTRRVGRKTEKEGIDVYLAQGGSEVA